MLQYHIQENYIEQIDVQIYINHDKIQPPLYI